jgi:hypothetical protein
LHRNLEAGRRGDAERTKHIDDKAEKRLMTEIAKTEAKGEKGWSALHNCSTFAGGAWRAGTGEKLNSGLPNTPSTLKKSINKKNKSDD